MVRAWKEMKSDEIWSIWSNYVRTDFTTDSCGLNYYEKDKPIKLTPMEIHRLVEELLDRLEIKEGTNG